MTFPTDVDLDIIYRNAFHASNRSSDSTWSLDGIAAVRRAIIEALAQEADERAKTDYYYFGYDDVPGWLRAHLEDKP